MVIAIIVSSSGSGGRPIAGEGSGDKIVESGRIPRSRSRVSMLLDIVDSCLDG